MAWRIHEYVVRGEIDNRKRGTVTGKLWLAGVDDPIQLELKGDCQPDLAGSLLTLENPAPIKMTTKPLAPRQRGTAGTITAARKIRVFDGPVAAALAAVKRGDPIPERTANSVHVEWFSALSGHVIVQSPDYKLNISEPVWRFSVEEAAEIERCVAEGNTAIAAALDTDGATGGWDEIRYEQFLRESDALNERYGRLLEKYGDEPEAERLIAREMGWKWLEDALSEEEAKEASEEETDLAEMIPDSDDFELPPPDPAREGIDWVRDERGRVCHPIKKRSNTAMRALLDELKESGHFPDCDDDELGDFVGGFMKLTAKLAGALGGVARGDDHIEPGLIIAWLKRILEILNDNLTSADRLIGKPFLSAERLAFYRNELFGVREDVLALIARLRSRQK